MDPEVRGPLFGEWTHAGGDLAHNRSCTKLKIGPGTAVVLTDAAAVKELMDRRGGNTISRPSMHIADRVTGGLYFSITPYSEHSHT
jgi:hypothetical protein